jgi:DNA-binding LacI/PurR family transcriptional regulator
MATLKDIAEIVGTTPIVVSHVVRGVKGNIRVSRITRERILEVAKELKYTPNRNAQALTKGKTSVIAFITANPGALLNHLNSTSFFQIIGGGEIACKNQNYSCLYTNVDYDNSENFELPHCIRCKGVDGVVIMTYASNTLVKKLEQIEMPFVHIGTNIDFGNTQVTNIYPDFDQAFEKAARHLVKNGCRNIHLMMPKGPGPEKHVNFFRNLDSKIPNIKTGHSYVEFSIPSYENIFEQSYRITNEIAQKMEPGTTFIISESFCDGFFQSMLDNDKVCPNDYKALSFGSINLESKRVPPNNISLSYIKSPGHIIGKRAAVHLLHKIGALKKIPDEEKRLQVPCELILKESTS